MDITELLNEKGSSLTDRRKELFEKTINQRTRHFCMVLEDLRDPHNMSAVIRTSEVFGLQDVHIIEEVNPWKISRSILKGSFKWMSLYRYKQRSVCMSNLKKKGYRIAVASTNTTNTLDSIDLSIPTAFYLGSEFKGNHPDTLDQADVEFILPQYGMTESLNVSVAAGVLMTNLNFFLQKEGRENFTLSDEEKTKLIEDWIERTTLGIEANSPLHIVSEA